jgi:hypothetical protein
MKKVIRINVGRFKNLTENGLLALGVQFPDNEDWVDFTDNI